MSPVRTLSCTRCNWRFFHGDGAPPAECPHCRSQALTEGEADSPYEPELSVPFSVSGEEFAARVEEFAGRIPYPPADLNAGQLVRRARRIFLPQYLVDADVAGRWQAEMGFDYQVVSHQEQLEGGSWQSVEKEETRTNWEKRVGTLKRSYHNVRAPALEDDRALMRALGAYSLRLAEPFSGLAPEIWVRLPDRSTRDAWPDAVPGFIEAGMEECRLAAAADHVRGYSWDAAYTGQHWTQLLLPVFTTFYLDDDGQPQRLLMNGQTGALAGVQKASMKRARGASLRILAAAIVIFVLGLLGLAFGAVFPPALVIGAGLSGLAFIVGLGAVVPVFRVWQFNR